MPYMSLINGKLEESWKAAEEVDGERVWQFFICHRTQYNADLNLTHFMRHSILCLYGICFA